MKNFKQASILLAVGVLFLSACTPQMDNDSEMSNAGDTQNSTNPEPVQLPEEVVDSADEISNTSIIGMTWTWVRFDDTADMNNIVVENPSLYTLLLSEDGTYTLKADCNMASGSYTLEGSSITFQAGPITLAECGPESLYNTYLTQMGAEATFVMDGENLVLNMWADGGNLVFSPVEDVESEDSVETEDTADESEDSGIIGTTWMWVRFDDTADMNNIVVEDPSLYTLLLHEDGTYSLKADCNRASGNYTLEGSSIAFQEGPTTLAECGPESLYNTYLTRMGAVATFVMDGENLVLNMWADGGNLVFAPAE